MRGSFPEAQIDPSLSLSLSLSDVKASFEAEIMFDPRNLWKARELTYAKKVRKDWLDYSKTSHHGRSSVECLL